MAEPTGPREIVTRIMPYDDGSGYRYEARGDCNGPTGERVRVTLVNGDDAIRMTYLDWMQVKAMVDEAFEILATNPVKP